MKYTRKYPVFLMLQYKLKTGSYHVFFLTTGMYTVAFRPIWARKNMSELYSSFNDTHMSANSCEIELSCDDLPKILLNNFYPLGNLT